MKMSNEHYTMLSAACEPLNTEFNRAAYRNGAFPRADRCKDVNKRFRWDVLYASKIDLRPFYDADMNDEHIDTALRRIIPTL